MDKFTFGLFVGIFLGWILYSFGSMAVWAILLFIMGGIVGYTTSKLTNHKQPGR